MADAQPVGSRFKVPNTLVLLFALVVIAFLMTYLLPQGAYQRAQNEQGREQVVAGTYEQHPEQEYMTPLAIFMAIPRGFEAAQGIIFFVFIVGGAFGVFRATGAADAMIGALLDRFSHVPALLIAGGMVVFAAGSATIGMAEEYLPFVPILLALAIALGYDSIVAVGILCVGYAVGYGAALINPFTVMIAQSVAGIPPGSGLWFRLILLVVFLIIGFHHVWSYAQKIKADPSKSLVADIPQEPTLLHGERVPLNAVRIACIGVIVAGIGVLIYGLIALGWYLVEMGALFLILAILLGIIGRLGFDRTATEFAVGATELTMTALLIGFARSIQLVLEEGRIVDTIIHGISMPLQAMGSHAAAIGMLVVQSLCNLFIPSGSGQAYVTMPIMAPLADIVGVTRQVSVLAYQFGDGFTNILVPTSAVLIGILGLAKIPYDRWFRFIMPFMIKVWIVAAIALVVAVSIELQ
jgi:uncharacterized ion transporter superfamily protein YfcC